MNLHDIILSVHKGFGYLILLLILVFITTILACMFGYSGKISKLLKKSTLFTMMFFHIQLLVGLVMLFATSGFMNIIQTNGMSGVMKNADYRFTFIEHPSSMIICAVLMTIINKYMKTNDKLSLKIVFMSFLVVLLFGYAFPWSRVFINA